MVFDDAQTDLLLRANAEVLRRRGLGVDESHDPWFREYEGRELDFATENLGYVFPGTDVCTLWPFQQKATQVFFEDHFISIRGARTCGKSELLGGVIIPTFMSTAPSQALILGPTQYQILDNVWAKTRTTYGRAVRPLPGEMHTTFWRIPEDEQCFAKILAAKTPEHVRGPHAGRLPPIPEDLDQEVLDRIADAIEDMRKSRRRLGIFIDEANAISQATYRVLEGMLHGDNVYVWLQANPYLDAMEQHYYVQSQHPESRYKTFRVSAISDRRALELGGEADPLVPDYLYDAIPPEISDQAQVEDQLRTYDINDPVLAADVRGMFGSGNLSSLVIPRRALETALAQEPDKELPRHEGPSVGLDIGIVHDKCVATLLMDGEMVARHEWLPEEGDRKKQVTIARDAVALLEKWGAAIHKARPLDWAAGVPIPGERVHVDDSGMVGVCDWMAEEGVFVDRVNFGEGPSGQWFELVGETGFYNVRAEMAWCCRRGLQEGIFRVPRRFAQVWLQSGWVRYGLKNRSGGAVVLLEPKEDVKARHGRSPDDLDSFWLACRETGARAEFILSGTV